MPFDSLPLTNDLVIQLTRMHSLLGNENGWIQRKATDGKDGYCLLGAATKVGLPLRTLAEVLGYKHVSSVSRWNDVKSRTQAQVLEKLEKTIDRERQKIFRS